MSRTLSLAWLLVSGTLLSLALAAASPAANKEVIVVRRCAVEYRHTTNLGAPVPGILQDCLVELGARVKAGQVLGRLQDAEQQANIKVAEANYKMATIRVKTAEQLVSSSARAIAREEFELLLGKQAAEAATLEAARAAVRIREIVSPYDGVVVEIFKARGESVLPAQGVHVTSESPGPRLPSNDCIFRVVNLDTLRVTGYLDVVDAWRVQAGQAVRVTPESAGPDLPIQQQVFSGRVVFVDSEIDPKTRTCKVVAEVDNREGLLRSGLEVRMEIDAGSPTNAPTAALGRTKGAADAP